MAAPTHKPITWDWLKMALPIVIVVVGVVASFVTIQVNATYFERRLCILEDKAEKTQDTYATIQTQLVAAMPDMREIMGPFQPPVRGILVNRVVAGLYGNLRRLGARIVPWELIGPEIEG